MLNGRSIIAKARCGWNVNKGDLIPIYNSIANETRSTYMLPKGYIALKTTFNFNNRNSLILNHTETLATQANFHQKGFTPGWIFLKSLTKHPKSGERWKARIFIGLYSERCHFNCDEWVTCKNSSPWTLHQATNTMTCIPKSSSNGPPPRPVSRSAGFITVSLRPSLIDSLFTGYWSHKLLNVLCERLPLWSTALAGLFPANDSLDKCWWLSC